MKEASWVQKRKELIQSSIILELRTDSYTEKAINVLKEEEKWDSEA